MKKLFLTLMTASILMLGFADKVTIKSTGASGNAARTLKTEVQYTPASEGLDIMPFSIDDDILASLVAGEVYTLKEGAGSPAPHHGCFMAMDYDRGGGANLYKERIINGYQTDTIPTITYTESGNMAGPTIDGVTTRVETGVTTVLIPVIRTEDIHGNDPLNIIEWKVFELLGVWKEGPGAGHAIVQGRFLRNPTPEDLATQEEFDVLSKTEINE